MPNWCTNTLVIRGRRADVREFIQFLDAIKPGAGLFDAICPMPADLHDTVSPTRIVSEEERAEYISGKRERHGGIPITARMQLDFKLRYGVDNWYDWAVDAWGTKWDTTAADMHRADWKNGAGTTLIFDTAWGPPSEVISKLSSKFPKLKVSLKYHEPGMCLKGTESYGPHE